MKSKTAVFAMAAALALSLSSCGGSGTETPSIPASEEYSSSLPTGGNVEQPNTTEPKNNETPSISPNADNADTTMSAATPESLPHININPEDSGEYGASETASTVVDNGNSKAILDEMWTESTTWTDDDGYTYKLTVKGTPWLPWKSEEVQTVWDEIGKGNTLPQSIEDWGISRYNSGGAISYGTPYKSGYNNLEFVVMGEMTDFYYVLGTARVENITEGWDITAENPRSFGCAFIPACYLSGANCKYECMIIYGDGARTMDQFLYISPKMKSNTWGEVPFIMAHAENISPKFPNGEYLNELSEYTSSIGPYNIMINEEGFRGDAVKFQIPIRE